MTGIIDGVSFQRMIVHAAAAINAQKQQINELNVFPVPDGDTGTNMSMTISTAAAEMGKGLVKRVGIQDQFGQSAPYERLLEMNGVTVENIVSIAKNIQ